MEEACKSLKLVRFFIFSPLSFSSRRFFFVRRVLSHRFHRYTQIFFIMIFLHRISRRNRRHSCLSDYSRIFAEFWPLANGSRPIYAPVVFVTQISQMTQIFLCVDYFVPQISQMTQIFLCVDYFVPQISQMTQIFLCVDYFVTQISQMTQIFLCGDYFVPQISQIYTDFSLWDFFQPQGVSAPTGQVASVKIRE